MIAHDYLDVDLDLLASGANAAVADFRAYATAVARWLEADTAP